MPTATEYVAFAGIQTVFESHSSNTKDKVIKIQLQYEFQLHMGYDPGFSGDYSPPVGTRRYDSSNTN